MPRDQALYVLVRKDLPKSSQAVQAAHAVAQFVIENSAHWNNGTLVFLAAPDEAYLGSIKQKISDRRFSEFREPDLNDQITAIAVLGSKDCTVSDFPELKLL